MKLIPLTQGECAIVDDCDFEQLNRWKWSCMFCGGRRYAYRGTRNRRAGTQTTILMHRQILNAPDGVEVDHVHGAGLNNRRGNLRFASHQQNLFNSKIRTTNKSGYCGVTFDKDRGKWFASIRINGKTKGLGRFETPKEAALEWNRVALESRGEFARLNVI